MKCAFHTPEHNPNREPHETEFLRFRKAKNKI